MQNFVPVAGVESQGGSIPFEGSLDGQNFSISNLNIDLTGSQKPITGFGIGLFSTLYRATVKNLFFLNSVVKSSGKKCLGGGGKCTVGILAGKKKKFTF